MQGRHGSRTPYSIAAGLPAKIKRTRFAPDIVERIQALAWWDWDHERLASALPDFQKLSPTEFLARHGG